MLRRRWKSRKRERRRSPRLKIESLTAQYWTGAAPQPRPVVEVSLSGGVIETDGSYYPGTLMRVSLDAPAKEDSGQPAASFVLWTRVMRNIPGGICVEFAFQNQGEIEGFKKFLDGLKGRESREPMPVKNAVVPERQLTD
jgi:hypothetical protein